MVFWGLCFFIALIIVIAKASKKNIDNKKKVAEFKPLSQGYVVYHVSGLPVAERVEMYLYNCADRILISDADNNFSIMKNKVKSVNYATAKGFNLLWQLTINYESNGESKTVAVNGPMDLEKIKKLLDKECSTVQQNVEL